MRKHRHFSIKIRLRSLWKSFVSLRQEAPHDPEQYWFIQCLISICGPGEGQYVVQCGYAETGGQVLLERYCPDLEAVFALFHPALEYEPMDFSGFTQFLRQPDGSWQAVQSI